MSCAAVILLKSRAKAVFLYKMEQNGSILCFAIVTLIAPVNTSIYYRLL